MLRTLGIATPTDGAVSVAEMTHSPETAGTSSSLRLMARAAPLSFPAKRHASQTLTHATPPPPASISAKRFLHSCEGAACRKSWRRKRERRPRFHADRFGRRSAPTDSAKRTGQSARREPTTWQESNENRLVLRLTERTRKRRAGIEPRPRGKHI